MPNANLGSVRADFVLDLSGLEAQIKRAESLLNGLQNKASKVQGSDLGTKGISAGSQGDLGDGGATAASGALVGLASKAAVALGAFLVLKKGAELAFSGIKTAVTNAANFEQLDTSIAAIGANSGYTTEQIQNFSGALRDLNLFGGEAKQSILNLLNAQLPLNDNTFKLVGAAQNLAVAYGTTTTQALNTITQAIGSLNPALLEQFGITENLPAIYDRYALSLGVSTNALSEAQKRQAVMNEVLQQGNKYLGIAQLSNENVGRSYTILGANINTIAGTLGSAFLPVIGAVLKPLAELSRTMAGFLVDNEGRLRSFGTLIANYVGGAVQQFIGWLKSIPWNTVANGVYIGLQVLQIFGRILVEVGQQSIGLGQQVIGAIQLVYAGFQLLINPIVLVADAASQMWSALRGQQSFSAAFKNIGALTNALGNDFTKTINSAVKNFQGGGARIASSAKSLKAGVGADLNQIFSGFDFANFWNSLPNEAKKGMDGATKAAANGLSGMSAQARKQLADLARELAKANQDYARQQAKNASDFAQQLEDLVIKHRDSIASIQKSIQDEKNDFAKSQADRAKTYQQELDKLNDSDSKRKKQIKDQIEQELAVSQGGDRLIIAQLQARLANASAEHDKAVAELKAKYDDDTANAQEASNNKLAELQVSLDKELAIQQKYAADFAAVGDKQAEDDITKLKANYATQRAEEERQHQERLADLARRGNEIVGQNQQNGAAAGSAFGGGLSGALSGLTPTINEQSKNIGKGISNKTGEGARDNAGGIGDGLRRALESVGNGILTGVFGPIGPALWNIGRDIVGRISNGIQGNVGTFGRSLVAAVGKGLYDTLPGPLRGPFKSSWGGLGLPIQGFAQGGIVGGNPGVDQNVAMVSRGEMVLTKQQQANLYTIIKGGTPSQIGGTTQQIAPVYHIYNNLDMAAANKDLGWQMRNA